MYKVKLITVNCLRVCIIPFEIIRTMYEICENSFNCYMPMSIGEVIGQIKSRRKDIAWRRESNIDFRIQKRCLTIGISRFLFYSSNFICLNLRQFLSVPIPILTKRKYETPLNVTFRPNDYRQLGESRFTIYVRAAIYSSRNPSSVADNVNNIGS